MPLQALDVRRFEDFSNKNYNGLLDGIHYFGENSLFSLWTSPPEFHPRLRGALIITNRNAMPHGFPSVL